ncbi:MAG: ACT domain-containing protein [Oscillospiraceae bacterium]|nr:ACT domain-containing protein [Oscillospiraceae bacterium]
MELKIIDKNFSICKVTDFSQTDLGAEFCFTARTDEECSLVCPVENVPSNVTTRDDNWKALRIQGVLDFSLIGILSGISAVLAENKIGIFVVSTYNTDYILVKESNLVAAVDTLKENGYTVIS